MRIELCPAQGAALEQLRQALPVGNVFILYGGTGLGKTTVLRELHRELGGTYLTIGDFVQAMQGENPLALEETLAELVMTAWEAEDTLFFDDLDMVYNVVCGCHYGQAYPRQGFLE